MSFIYNMADTWNAGGTTFNGIYMNISNGAGGAPVGAAASRAFRLDANGTSIFDIAIGGTITWTGGFLPSVSNTYDVGSPSLGVKDYYGTGNIRAGASGTIFWTGRSNVLSPGTGIITIYNDSNTDFNRLQFGGTTNAFPSLKRSGTGVLFQLADDSAGTWSKDGVYTVASLPSAATSGIGAHLFVSDALAPAILVTVAGGGAAATPVFSDGTNWKVG